MQQNLNETEFISDAQHKIEFLRYLVIGLILLLFMALLVMLTPPIATIVNFVIIGTIIGLNFVVFYLNSHGFNRLAAHIFCHNLNILILIAIFLNIVTEDLTQRTLASYLLSLTIFLAGMLINRNAIVGFTSLNISMIFISTFSISGTIGIALISSFPTIFFLIFIAIISWLYQKTLEHSYTNLSRAHQQLLQTELITHELQIARDLQNRLCPPAPQIGPQLTIASRSKSALETSSDFYDFVWRGPHELGIIIANVMGKSLAAALIMAMTRSIMRSKIHQQDENPGSVLHKTNQVLFDDYAIDQMITAFYGILDTETFTFQFSNAGHLSPILKRNEELDDLFISGLPLRTFPDAEYTQKIIQLQPGDQLILLTDGIIEAMNTNQDIFGFKRLHRVIRQLNNTTSEGTLDAIWQAVDNFRDETQPEDDRTIIVINIQDNHNCNGRI